MMTRLKQHLDLILIICIGGLLLVGVAGWLLLNAYHPTPTSPPVLNQLGELEVRVNDNAQVLESIPNKLVSEDEWQGYDVKQYASTKNENVLVTFWIRNDTIVEISYPVVLAEKALIDEVELPEAQSREFWDTELVNTKVRVFPTAGFAISYHNETRQAYNLFQFLPDQYQAFLSRHPEFSLEEEHAHEGEDWEPDIFETGTATGSAEITP